MSSPRSSQEIQQDSSPSSPRNNFSLFQEKMERNRVKIEEIQQVRQLMIAKTLKLITGSLVLKLDGKTDLSEIQSLGKLLQKNKSKLDDSDSDDEAQEYNQRSLYALLGDKIDEAMQPLVERYLKDEENGEDEKNMSLEDAVEESKPKYLAVYLSALINLLLSVSENEFEKDEIKQLKEFSVTLEYTKLDADTGGKIVDYLYQLPYKNPETKTKVLEGLIDYYMPFYNACLNHCKRIENSEKQTNEINTTLTLKM